MGRSQPSIRWASDACRPATTRVLSMVHRQLKRRNSPPVAPPPAEHSTYLLRSVPFWWFPCCWGVFSFWGFGCFHCFRVGSFLDCQVFVVVPLILSVDNIAVLVCPSRPISWCELITQHLIVKTALFKGFQFFFFLSVIYSWPVGYNIIVSLNYASLFMDLFYLLMH